MAANRAGTMALLLILVLTSGCATDSVTGERRFFGDTCKDLSDALTEGQKACAAVPDHDADGEWIEKNRQLCRGTALALSAGIAFGCAFAADPERRE